MPSKKNIELLDKIAHAHQHVKSGADFPKYIKEIKSLGITHYETFVADGHTDYFSYQKDCGSTKAKYENLPIAQKIKKELFQTHLKMHQDGKTDYSTFCRHCSEAGIEKWKVDILDMTCAYYSPTAEIILLENIPTTN